MGNEGKAVVGVIGGTVIVLAAKPLILVGFCYLLYRGVRWVWEEPEPPKQ